MVSEMRKRAAKEKDVSIFIMFYDLLFHEWIFPKARESEDEEEFSDEFDEHV